jgi:CBS domain-containing protein
MKVAEAMTRDVKVLSPDQTICDAARLMAEIDAGAVPVGENDKLVGMITDRDIAVRAVAEHKTPDTKIRDVMSKEILYCFEDQDVKDVAQNMGDNQVRRLPVVSRDKRLVGIVSIGDLSKEARAATAGKAMADITKPGGPHTQTHH